MIKFWNIKQKLYYKDSLKKAAKSLCVFMLLWNKKDEGVCISV